MADQPVHGDHCTSESRRKGTSGGAGRPTSNTEAAATTNNSSTSSTVVVGGAAPCGACKFLRRKCISGCIFAPHFGSDQGAARFAAVHKVFGASNVSKLLLHIPLNRRQDAVVTISYEAQARLADPVFGCVSTILALQQQVSSYILTILLINYLINHQNTHTHIYTPIYVLSLQSNYRSINVMR